MDQELLLVFHETMTEERYTWSLEDLKKSILDNAAEYDRIVRHQNEEEKDVEEGKGSEGQSTS